MVTAEDQSTHLRLPAAVSNPGITVSRYEDSSPSSNTPLLRNTSPAASMQRDENQETLINDHRLDCSRTTNATATTSRTLPDVRRRDQSKYNTYLTCKEINRASHLESRLCSCVETALGALEALELEDDLENPGCIDHVLRSKKVTLIRCAEILSCEDCRTSSRSMILIILLCQKVAGSYDRFLRVLSDQYSRDESLQSLRLHPTAVPQEEHLSLAASRSSKALFLRSYETDAAEEFCIYKCLIALQLDKWKTLLSQLLRQCRKLNLNRHSAMVTAVERKLDVQLKRCQKE